MLNPEQQACVDFRGPALFCVAIPGSGKTRTLTQAIVDRIKKGETHPSKILAVTFTRLAAHEMRRRLEELLPARKLRQMTVGTFHSICYDFIRANWQLLGYASKDIFVYDRHEQKRLLKEVIKTSRYRPTQTAVLKGLDQMAQTGEQPSELELTRDVHRVLDLYLRALLEHNAVDYSVVPHLALRLIEMDAPTPWLDIFVDEAQDLDPLQYRVFALLQPERIFFVGDPDQLIYGWRGADVSLMRQKAVDLKAEIKVLDLNYRSGVRILTAANSLIRHNTERIDKAMHPADPATPAEVHVIDETQQLDWIQAATERLDGTIAVLGRTNDLITILSNDLHARDIEHELIGRREKLLERPDIKAVLSYLCFPDYPLSPTVLTRVLEAEGFSNLDIERVRAGAKSKGQTFFDVVTDYDRREICPPLPIFYDDLNDEPSLIQKLGLVLARYRNLKGSLSALDETDLMTVASTFVRLERWKDRTPGNFISWLSLRDGQDEIKSDAPLQLMTIHAAKGLEFDTVFVAGLHDRVLPHKRNQEGEGLEEERRLMFVAMTRARKTLVLVESAEWPSRFVGEATGSD